MRRGSVANILLDGFNLGLEFGTGVATYARNLSYQLKAIGHSVSLLYGRRGLPSSGALLREIGFFDNIRSDPHEWVNVLGQVYWAARGPLGYRATEVEIGGKVISRSFSARMPAYDHIFNASDVFRRSHSAFMLWNTLTAVTLPMRPDLAHWTYPVPLRVKRVPNIYTLHDLVPLRLPYTTLDRKRTYLKMMGKIAQQADHIVTVSEHSKRDLVDLLGISADRVTNTYQSVSIPAKYRCTPISQVAETVEGAVGVGYKDYLLFWGAIEPKKNIGRMIEAYLSSGVEAPLVIVGARGWKSEPELKLLNDDVLRFLTIANGEVRTRKRIIQLSYAPFSLLVSLIRGAKIVLFPSLYEGFGLPALEAMLLGTPVICSNTASLPEVVGSAAVTIDPYDTAALSAAIRMVDHDADMREEMSRRGTEAASLFSPERYRDRLHSVYRRFV